MLQCWMIFGLWRELLTQNMALENKTSAKSNSGNLELQKYWQDHSFYILNMLCTQQCCFS